MQTDYEPILFDAKSLFIDRRRRLETVASLGDFRRALVARPPPPEPVSVSEAVESMDVETQTQYVPRATPLALERTHDHTLAPLARAPVSSHRTEVLTPPGGTVVFSLFRYLEATMVQRLRPTVQQLLDVVQANCPMLLDLWQSRASQLDQALEGYTRRFIVNTLSRDENGTRVRHCLQQLEELYLIWGVDPRDKSVRLVPGGKANAAHVELYHGLLKEVYEVSRNPKTDTFYETCADTRPRGRQPRAVSNNPPHPLNQLKKDYINSLKSAPPVVFDETDGKFYLAHEATQPLAASQLTVDYYPLFFKMLGIVNACVPRADNHGHFTERVREATRKLTPAQWPMHGLVQALGNLRGVLERKRVCVRARPGRRYYCCYTGQELEDGEEVWLLRLLTLSPEQHLKWVRMGRPPTGSKADHPDLVPSIRSFFMKTRVRGVCSVFNAGFAEEYRQRYANYYSQALTLRHGPAPRLLPVNRRYVYNPLWRLMQRLHNHVVSVQQRLYDGTERESYHAYRERMDPLLRQLGADAPQLRYVVFTGLFGVSDVSALGPVLRLETERISELVDQVLDTVTDMLDLTIDFSPGDGGSDGLVVHHSTFPVSLLEEEEGVTMPLQTTVRPDLNIEAPLLVPLFRHSDRRRVERSQGEPSKRERQARLWRLQQCLRTHPFLMLTLHDTLYRRCDQMEQLSQTDVRRLYAALSLRLV